MNRHFRPPGVDHRLDFRPARFLRVIHPLPRPTDPVKSAAAANALYSPRCIGAGVQREPHGMQPLSPCSTQICVPLDGARILHKQLRACTAQEDAADEIAGRRTRKSCSAHGAASSSDAADG